MKHLCLSIAAGLLLAGLTVSCETFGNGKQQEETLKPLTPEDIARMTPKELDDYFRKQEQAKRKKQAKSTAELIEESKYSVQKRKKLYDVSHPVLHENDQSIFPWRTSNRSEKLHESLDTTNR